MRTLTLLTALLSTTFAFAQDEEGGEEEAPHYELAEVGVRVDIPEEGWKSDHWSEWDFKATSDDGIVLVVWTTPYQIDIKEAELGLWAPVYTKQAETQGGVEPKMVSQAMRDVQGIPASDVELTMGTSKGIDLVMLASSFVVRGQDLHVATVAMKDRKAAARKELDGVLERMEINKKAEPLTWGGAVTAPGLDATLTDYWRAPSKFERSTVMEKLKGIGVASLKGCWMAIHPHAGGTADLLATCKDEKHVFPIVNDKTFADQEGELRNAWLGSDEPGEVLTLPDRRGFQWHAKVGSKKLHIAAVPVEGGLAKSVAYAKGGDDAVVGEQMVATLNANHFAAPVEADVGENLRYYLQYEPFSPVVLGPIIGAVLVFILILGVIIFGLRRQSQLAREELDAV